MKSIRNRTMNKNSLFNLLFVRKMTEIQELLLELNV